jgi:hypothetical protein
MGIDAILWRRLDTPGHDACRLEQTGTGWRLDGMAAFRHEGGPTCLAYQVECDEKWRTSKGSVQGWVGARRVDLLIRRTPAGVWTLQGKVAPHLEGCFDLDFGFTPATNLFQLRRVALQVGQSATVPVAWLDVADSALQVLRQLYVRRAAGTYWYEAPRFGYAAALDVLPVGFILRYPGLWEAESE